MAWKPGQSGNPEGYRREQKCRAALDRAIAQDDSARLRRAVEKLLDLAADGVPWAISMLFDRVDGKAEQTINHNYRAEDMTDNDLLRVAAGSSNRATSQESSEEKSSELH